MLDFGVGDAGEIALGCEKRPLVRPIELRDVERTGEIGHEHAVAWNIQRDADAFHEVRDHDLRHILRGLRVDGRAVHRVAARGIAAIGPVEDAMFEIDLEIDRLGKTVEEDLDVAAIGRRLARRNVDPGAQDAPDFGVVSALLRPVDLSPLGIDGNSNAPSRLVAAVMLRLLRSGRGFRSASRRDSRA